MDMHTHDRGNESGGKIGRWIFWGFALIAAYFVYTEHREHLFAALPYLLLAACPLMHLFHHGHGHHHHDHHDGKDEHSVDLDPNDASAPLRHDH